MNEHVVVILYSRMDLSYNILD